MPGRAGAVTRSVLSSAFDAPAELPAVDVSEFQHQAHSLALRIARAIAEAELVIARIRTSPRSERFTRDALARDANALATVEIPTPSKERIAP